jgi:carbamoyltransferase
VVIDAIGEWDTLTVWEARGREMKKVYSATYPDSLGLLYSAFTQRCGFKPNEEEYIMMAAAAHGNPEYADHINKDFFSHEGKHELHLKQNVHLGIGDWLPEARVPELAASIQKVTEEYLIDLFQWVAATTRMKNVVFMGGVALNCVANSKIAARGIFDDIWIMPNPGDAGSSLGAALAFRKDFVEWKGPYLGSDIDKPHETDVDGALAALRKGEVIGFTNGRAEFGPRALGNRSLLADPRFRSSRNRMNNIKNREPFRPFAAAILEEEAHRQFYMPIATSPYMQYVARVKAPRAFPAICHIDSTCRVQTVNREQNPEFYDLLKRWFAETGCPMLMNTSLNIKGSALVNTWADAQAFTWVHDVKVF